MSEVWTMLTFLVTAYNVGYCVYKPTPFSIGLAVLTGLCSLREIFRRRGDNQ
jgi:hypothetical protein